MNELIYITGHKNPDTDSICSAIAYAELKKRNAIDAVPIRIGDINKEIILMTLPKNRNLYSVVRFLFNFTHTAHIWMK